MYIVYLPPFHFGRLLQSKLQCSTTATLGTGDVQLKNLLLKYPQLLHININISSQLTSLVPGMQTWCGISDHYLSHSYTQKRVSTCWLSSYAFTIYLLYLLHAHIHSQWECVAIVFNFFLLVLLFYCVCVIVLWNIASMPLPLHNQRKFECCVYV